MGYSTDFTGELKFNQELTASQLSEILKLIEEDDYADLELIKDFSGVCWDGMEKTREMVESVNRITIGMQRQWPKFRFTGQLSAQGEEYDDRGTLVIDDDGIAKRVDVVIVGDKVVCPNCDYAFIVGEKPKK